MNNNSKARLSLIFSIFVFGTIGIFRKYIPLSSGLVAIARGLLDAVLILGSTMASEITLKNRQKALEKFI